MYNSRWYTRYYVFVISVMILLAAPSATYGQGSLQIQTDIRSRGMGEIAAAVPDNPAGFLFNPACLTEANTIFGRASYGDWLPLLEADFYLYAAAIGFSEGPWLNFGAGLQRFDHGSYGITDYTGSLIYVAEPYDLAAYLSYAAAPAAWLSAGITAKYIVLHDEFFDPRDRNTSTIGFDVGLLFHNLLPDMTVIDDNLDIDPNSPGLGGFLKRQAHPRSRGLSIGVSLQNVGPNFTFEDTSEELPLPHNLKLGLAARIVDLDPFGFLIGADMNRPIYSGMDEIFKFIDYHFGAELNIYRVLDVRIGYVSLAYSAPNYLTLGASLGVDKLHADISFIPESDDAEPLSETLMFGLSADF